MLVCDIETVPLAASMAAPYPEAERKPPANYKNADAIANWRAGDEAKWAEERAKECSLSPRLGRVVALTRGDDRGRHVDIAPTEGEERGLLDLFWGQLRQRRQLAGFQSHGFDFPFLLTRSLLLGVSPGVDVTPYLRRYTYQPHFDVRMALTQWDARQSGTLDDWCQAFGIPGKSGSASEVYDLVLAGDWVSLERYALADLAATVALVRRVAPVFGVPGSEVLDA